MVTVRYIQPKSCEQSSSNNGKVSVHSEFPVTSLFYMECDRLYKRDGTLAVTVVQEGLIRSKL